MIDEQFRRELIKKYQWAGKIRFVSFLLLFLFLLSMKLAGGYTYLNTFLVGLLFVEAILNQPYSFFLEKVNLYRFQFYQMTTDIIAISWILYYMGGIEAPVISIAYYALILWAGVVSGYQAVFFAVITASFFMSSVVILGHFGILPSISYFNYKLATAQMFSLLFANLAFLFAFGYFSAHSSKVIKFLERERQEEALKSTHKLLATGYLLGAVAHDIINHLASIRGYIKVLLEKIRISDFQDKGFNTTDALVAMERLESENIELLSRLLRFSRKQKEKPGPTDLNKDIEEALGLILPLAKAADVIIEKRLEEGLPLVMADKDQMQEVFVTLFLNSLEAMPKKGKIAVKTFYLKEDNSVKVVLSDTGSGIRQDYLKRITDPFFTPDSPQEQGFSFKIAHEIVNRHKGKLDIESPPGKGTTITIRLPAA